ncbi:MAG TPA: peptidyl-prolyl cis-trans isomerase, partial [Tabrizicola sp.]|nr:peptidyl-prolyl cis-trans isomerase [Tabrizicola sp.]
MTKHTDDDTPRAKSKSKEVAGWLLMGLLVLGLGGFGVTSFGGRVSTLGQVGDVEITADDYARAVQIQASSYAQQLGIQVSAQELLALGLGEDVLRGLIARAALSHEAGRIGLSVGDEGVASQVVKMPEFQGVAGTFDRETYRFQLDRMNQTEAEFEASIRRDVSLKLMQNLISGGITAPATMTEHLHLRLNEKRGFSLLRLTEADLAVPLAAPAEADLTGFYDAHPDMFIKPEAKRITVAMLLPQDIAAEQAVDEAEIQALYDSRIEDYVRPERRIVERLVFPDQAAADAARAKLDGGASFEDLVTERGITLSDTDLGDVEKEDLGQAGEAVFAASEGTVVGPLPSNLGPALFRVSVVLAAEETAFASAREELLLELQTEAARAVIDGKFEAIDDLLAGGATLEDLAADEGLKIATLDYVPGTLGATPIEGYEAFRTAAEAVGEGDFSEAIPLEDGGVFALRLDEIVAAAPIPFADAREAVTAAWRAEALAKALSTRAAEIKSAVEGGASIGSFGIVEVTPEAGRSTRIEGAPDSLIEEVFSLTEGAVLVIDGEGLVG